MHRLLSIFLFLLCMANIVAAQQASRAALSATDTQPGNPAPKTHKNNTEAISPRPKQDATPANTLPLAYTAASGTKTNTIPAKTKKTARGVQPTSNQAKSLRPAAETPKINWITIEEAMEKSKTEKRKFYIDVYTDWCGWCKRMDETTFQDPVLVKYINEKYYAVKFNAEQTQAIAYKGKNYQFKKIGERGYHELAGLWLNNKMSYPTSVVLDENQDVIQPISGYLEALKLDAILHYFGSDSHKAVPWEKYERNFVREK